MLGKGFGLVLELDLGLRLWIGFRFGLVQTLRRALGLSLLSYISDILNFGTLTICDLGDVERVLLGIVQKL